jgi:hypothetical protein
MVSARLAARNHRGAKAPRWSLGSVLQRLGLILIGVLLPCLGLEIMLRNSDAVPEVGSPTRNFHDSDPYLGWSGKPNVRLRYHRPEFDTLVELDGGGWRRPLPPRPPDPARRILVLGDSFTWGWGVGQGEVFTDLLQARLPATVAVYNRGVIGFGTAQEYLLLERELAAAHYDTVVLMFFINDVVDNTDTKDGHRPYFDLVDGRLVAHKPSAALRTYPLDDVLQHSLAYRFIALELGNLKRRFRGEAEDERSYHKPGAVDFHDLPGYPIAARLLGEMNRLVREHGARFFLVYIPQRSEFELASPYPYPRAVHAMVEDIAQHEGMPLVDLTAPSREQTRAGRELVFPVDAHWSAAGHQMAADVLWSSPIFQPQ